MALTPLRRPTIIENLTLAIVRAWNKLTSDNIDRLNEATGNSVTSLQSQIDAITTTGPVPGSRQVIAGTGLSGGGALTADVTLSADFGSGAGTICEGNDSRLSDSRTPIGSAGGDLTGTYPNPTITSHAVTYAKIQQETADTLLGNPTGSTANVSEITLDPTLAFSGTTIQRAALTGDVTASAGSNSTTIATNAVTDAKLRQGTAHSVIGRSANSTGNVADIASSADNQVLMQASSALTFAQLAASNLSNGTTGSGSIVLASSPTLTGNLQQTFASTVTPTGTTATIDWSNGVNQTLDLGSASGNVTLTFSNPVDGARYVLQIKQGATARTITWPSTLYWPEGGSAPTLSTTSAVFDVITMVYDSANTKYRVVAPSPSNSTPAAIGTTAVGTGVQFARADHVHTISLTGDVTSSSGVATTIAANAVTDAKLRQGGALTVIGRSANSTGNVADIQATAASDAVLRESGSTLGFGTIATGGIAANAVTDAKLRQGAGLSVIGRSANTTGNVADITGTDGQILRVSGTTLGFGKVKTSQITGTATNDNATAGDIGEYATASVGFASRITLTTATPANITSLSLTAGDWDIGGIAEYGDTPTGGTQIALGLSTTSATFSSFGFDAVRSPTMPTSSTPCSLVIPSIRFSLSTTTTVYLVASMTFTGGTGTAWGHLVARRPR